MSDYYRLAQFMDIFGNVRHAVIIADVLIHGGNDKNTFLW